jgi:hypothetical protein
MSNFVQWAQLGVASAQLQQMQQLSAQFQAQWRAQHDAQRRQAILADMLFQTERRAKQLSALAERDAIVSAMFADEWLSSVRFVGPEAFVQIEHKKVWAAATSRLQALTAPLADPTVAGLVQQVRGALAEINQLRGAFGANTQPEQRFQALSAERADLTSRRSRAARLGAILGAVAVGGPVVIFVLSAIVAAILQGSKTMAVDGGCVGTLVFFSFLGFGGAAAYNLASWSDLGSKLRRTDEEAQRLGHAIGQLQAFQADPNRGGALARFQHEHPAVNQPLPNVDDAAPLSAAGGPPSHIIERQTVVVRCRYCQTLTPVDGATCRNCGAAGFS